MNGLFYWISDVLNSHLLNKCFVFSRKSFVCLNSFFIYLFMSNKQKQKEMKFEQALETANPLQAFEAMQKVLKKRNAEKFIQSLGIKFSESQKQNFIEVLCKYESFLENQ